MLDHDADVPTAIRPACARFAANTGPLLLWAALLVSLTLIGFATRFSAWSVIMTDTRPRSRGTPTRDLVE